MTHVFIALCSVGLAGVAAYGADSGPLAGAHPLLIERLGEPIRLIFTDGRVATLTEGATDVYPVSVRIDVSENACVPDARLPRCFLEGNARTSRFRWAWSQHSTAAKIGATMTYGGTTPVQIDWTWSPTYRSFEPAEFQELGDYSLRCDDYAWTGSRNGPPESLSMSAWNAESMFFNAETHVSENTTVSGALGLRFVRTSPDSFRLASVDSWFSLSRVSISSSLIGQGVAWAFLTPAGGECQISGVMDIGALFIRQDAALANGFPQGERAVFRGSDKRWQILPIRLPVNFPEWAFQ